MKCIPLLVLLSFCNISIEAQKTNSFLIYSVKGSVTTVENNKGTKVKIGKLLTDKSRLTVGPNSLVSIICNESSLFSVTKAGSYSMEQFKDSCQANKSSITSNYLKFIWNQLTTPKGNPEKNRKNYMNNVGAVSRTSISVWVDSRFDTINYNNGTFPVSWKCYSDADEFTFEVYQMARGGQPVYQKTVTKTSIYISDFAAQLNPNTAYYWKILAKGEESDERKLFFIWDNASYEKLLAQLRNTQKEFETVAEENFRLGFLLESARFYSEAYQHYKKAAQLNPSAQLFQKTLEAFKKDYNIEQ